MTHSPRHILMSVTQYSPQWTADCQPSLLHTRPHAWNNESLYVKFGAVETVIQQLRTSEFWIRVFQMHFLWFCTRQRPGDSFITKIIMSKKSHDIIWVLTLGWNELRLWAHFMQYPIQNTKVTCKQKTHGTVHPPDAYFIMLWNSAVELNRTMRCRAA